MDTYFLYLPVYYAIHKRLFGYLENLEEKYNFLRPQLTENAEKTDKAVFDSLIRKSGEEPTNIYFAIGDPRSIASKPNWSNSPVRLIGALIVGTPFWALDHGKCETLTLKDLCRSDTLVCYQPGTTSFDLISSALKDNGFSQGKIEPVPANTEIAKFMQDNENGSIIISPDIIGIVNCNEKKDYDIVEFPIGSDHDLAYLLVTALATTQETIYAHPGLVKAFIKAVQRSLNELHSRNPEIIAYAAELFTNNDHQKVLEALKFADQSHVYPHDIGINETLWMNALTRAIRANGEIVTDDYVRTAKQVYSLIGKSSQDFARTALNEMHVQLSPEANTIKMPLEHRNDSVGYLACGLLLLFLMYRLNVSALQYIIILGIPVLCYFVGYYVILPRLPKGTSKNRKTA
jgi:hypothetical protein